MAIPKKPYIKFTKLLSFLKTKVSKNKMLKLKYVKNPVLRPKIPKKDSLKDVFVKTKEFRLIMAKTKIAITGIFWFFRTSLKPANPRKAKLA